MQWFRIEVKSQASKIPFHQEGILVIYFGDGIGSYIQNSFWWSFEIAGCKFEPVFVRISIPRLMLIKKQ